MKQVQLGCLLLIITLIVCGCWNYRELDDVNIVSGLAIDKKEDKYIFTVETIKPGVGKKTKTRAELISAEGETPLDAGRNLIFKSGKNLYWAHAKAFIISEEIAKEGIVPVLDVVNRDPQIRSDMWVFVSKSKMAKDILLGKDPLHDTMAERLNDMAKAQKSTSKYRATELWKLIHELGTKGISSTLPGVNKGMENKILNPEITNTAVFKEDKIIGWLNKEETICMLLVKGELKGGLLIVENVESENTNVALEIYSSKTKVKPIIKEKDLVMKININMEVDIAEITSDKDLISKKEREKLKKEAEECARKKIKEVIKKVQRKYDSDIFGFASVVRRENPNLWKKINKNWDTIFRNLDTFVDIEIDIKGSALTAKPIKIGD